MELRSASNCEHALKIPRVRSARWNPLFLLSASIVVVLMVFVGVRVMPRSLLQQISNRDRNQGDDEESYSAHRRLPVTKKTAIAAKPAIGNAKRKPMAMSPIMRRIIRSHQNCGSLRLITCNVKKNHLSLLQS